jgi:FdrA protein
MLDVVIGYGSHPDPASELAPAIAKAIAGAKSAGRQLEVTCVVTGTDEDPQNFDSQVEQLRKAGAWVDPSNDIVVRRVGRIMRALNERGSEAAATTGKPVDLLNLKKPMAAINVGLESFAANLKDQDAPNIHVDWKPPAGGNEKLAGILERMNQKK